MILYIVLGAARKKGPQALAGKSPSNRWENIRELPEITRENIMSTRNPDGRFRNLNLPTVLSSEMLRAQWVELEAIRLKRDGLSYEAVAQSITQVGRGHHPPVTPLLDGVRFPPDYKITAMACHKAVRRALRRAPALEAHEIRRLDTERCEDLYHCLTAGIQQGDPQSARAAVGVLAHKAAINGYKSGEIRVAPRPGPKPLPLFLKPYKAMMELLAATGRPGLDLEHGDDADDPGLP